MALEIERKFLVRNDGWKLRASTGVIYRQGYLSLEKRSTVRVRVAGNRGFLTIKGLRSGITRQEYDFEIPIGDAEKILSAFCDRPPVEKMRYRVKEAGMTWEVDVFGGKNEGLVVAEIELETEDQHLPLPDWVGKEITHDERYLNVNLYLHPISGWLH